MLHTKGGVGKTTSCMFLAARAARNGIPTRVVDADPQGSAMSWADRAIAAGVPLPFAVTPANAAQVRALRSSSGELILLDIPPGTADTIDAAIEVADLVIIPTGCDAAEIDRVRPTLRITATVASTVLLTRVDMRTAESTVVPAELRAEGLPLLSNFVRHGVDIKRTFSRTLPRYLGDYGDVFNELAAATGLITTTTERAR